ncbi:hypothetical protein I5K34_32365, partial [Pseudomonas aeruginosa]|nr:hypothetical protein [Pseudomonas aeruginosa]
MVRSEGSPYQVGAFAERLHTIRKWVRAPEAKPPVYQRRAIFNKLSPFHTTLEQALKADSLRPKQQRR